MNSAPTNEQERLIRQIQGSGGARAVAELLVSLAIEARDELSGIMLTPEGLPIASRLQGEIEAFSSLANWIQTPLNRPPGG
jgi:hypothetical protein